MTEQNEAPEPPKFVKSPIPHQHLELPRAGDRVPIRVEFYRTHDLHMEARAAHGRYGASSVSTVLGLNPYDEPWTFWARRRGIAPPIEKSEIMEAGNRSEPMNCAWYRDKMATAPGQQILAGAMIVLHPTDELAHCSPDLLLLSGVESVSADANSGGFRLHGKQLTVEHGADAKNHSERIRHHSTEGRGYGDEFSDVVPMYIWYQLQRSLYCTGLPFWDVSAIFGGQKHRIFRVWAHAEAQAAMAQRVREFHELYILGDQEPPVGPDALAKMSGVFSSIYTKDNGESAEIVATELELVRHYTLTRAARESLQKTEEAIAAALKRRMKNTRRLVIPRGGTKGKDLVAVSWAAQKQSEDVVDFRAYSAALELLCSKISGAEALDLSKEFAALRSANMKPGRNASRPFSVKSAGNLAALQRMLEAAEGRVPGAPLNASQVAEIAASAGDDPESILHAPAALTDVSELLARALVD